MANLTVVRFAYAPWGTYGQITLPDGQILYTVEQPWNDNRTGISCIPEGDYQCAPRQYNRGGYPAIEITNVPGRSFILFHKANVPSDVRGCIGVGVDPGWIKGQWGVSNSRSAFGEMMDQVGGKDFSLRIRRYEPRGVA